MIVLDTHVVSALLSEDLDAGIAISRRATVATRNVRHDEGLPTAVVSPWSPG